MEKRGSAGIRQVHAGGRVAHLDQLIRMRILQLFQQKKLDAKKTLKVGEYPLDGKADPDVLAAMMKVADMIYNMEEAITKT